MIVRKVNNESERFLMFSLKLKFSFFFEISFVFFLLCIHFFLAFTGIINKTATFDELPHLGGGYSFWKLHDYRINPENGNFPQRWAALPLLSDKSIKFPVFNPSPMLESNEWLTCFDFMFKSGNNADKILLKARAMMILLSVILGIVVYLWSKRIFGRAGAAVSLLFYTFCPTILAHSGLVTSDISCVLGFILSTWGVWLMAHKITPWRILFSSLSLALLFLSKMSAPIILPVYLIIIAARLISKTPLEIKFLRRKYILDKQSHQLCVLLACGAMNILAVILFIWLSYGFNYSMMKGEYGKKQLIEQNWNEMLKDSGIEGKIVNFAREAKLLPEAYLFGFQFVMKKSEFRYAYLNGDCRLTGWWYFFPYCCLVKTPLPFIIFFIFVTIMVILKLRNPIDADLRKKIYQLTPLFALAGVYCVFALAGKINIGHRHVLVLYPIAFIFSGFAAYLFTPETKTYLKVSAIILAGWFVMESLKTWPHYLAYFNQLAGGPKNGYKHLVDSSLDWGQDLKYLKFWLKENKLENNDNVYLSYFGTSSIDYHLKINKLPCYMGQEGDNAFELKGGIYCISATMRPMIYMPELFDQQDLKSGLVDDKLYRELEADVKQLLEAQKKSSKDFTEFLNRKGRDYWVRRYRLYHLLRFAKICKYIQNREPDANAGYSILIYRLSDKEVSEALKKSFENKN